MESMVELTLRWLLTDVAATRAPRPRIEFATNPRTGEEASFWLHGTGSWGVVEHADLQPHEQAAHIAEEFQSWVIEENWGRDSNWPPCRLHPTTHPMQIVSELDTVHWACPSTGEALANLGQLYGGSWYANAPQGGGRDWFTGMSDLVSVGGSWHAESAPQQDPLEPDDETQSADGVPSNWLKIMPEWMLTLPLWDDGGPVEDRGDVRDLLGLPDPLLERLQAVQTSWEFLAGDVANDHDDSEGVAEGAAFDAVDEEALSARLALRDLGLVAMNELAHELGPDWRIHLLL